MERLVGFETKPGGRREEGVRVPWNACVHASLASLASPSLCLEGVGGGGGAGGVRAVGGRGVRCVALVPLNIE